MFKVNARIYHADLKSSSLQVFCKNDVTLNFVKFTRKHIWWKQRIHRNSNRDTPIVLIEPVTSDPATQALLNGNNEAYYLIYTFQFNLIHLPIFTW